jgi:hypothetical protein
VEQRTTQERNGYILGLGCLALLRIAQLYLPKIKLDLTLTPGINCPHSGSTNNIRTAIDSLQILALFLCSQTSDHTPRDSTLKSLQRRTEKWLLVRLYKR